jgi:hypothetical protein
MNKYEEFSINSKTKAFYQKELLDYLFNNEFNSTETILNFESDKHFVNSINLIKFILLQDHKDTFITINNVNTVLGNIDFFFNPIYLKKIFEIYKSEDIIKELEKNIFVQTTYYYLGKEYIFNFNMLAYNYLNFNMKYMYEILEFSVKKFLNSYEESDNEENSKKYGAYTNKNETLLEKINFYFYILPTTNFKDIDYTKHIMLSKKIFNYVKSIYKHEYYDENYIFDEEAINLLAEKYKLMGNIIEEIYSENIIEFIKKYIIKVNNKVFQDVLASILSDDKENAERLYIEKFRIKTIKKSEEGLFFENVKNNIEKIADKQFIDKVIAFSLQDETLHKYITYNLIGEFIEDLNLYIYDILDYDKEMNINLYINEINKKSENIIQNMIQIIEDKNTLATVYYEF